MGRGEEGGGSRDELPASGSPVWIGFNMVGLHARKEDWKIAKPSLEIEAGFLPTGKIRLTIL